MNMSNEAFPVSLKVKTIISLLTNGRGFAKADAKLTFFFGLTKHF
jgi:hypothetical protein